jgi:hypothetical protein
VRNRSGNLANKASHSCCVRSFTCHKSMTWEDKMSQGSSVSVASDYGLDKHDSIPGSKKRIFFLVTASRPALKPTQPPIQWVIGVKHSWGMTMTTHPHLVLTLRTSRSHTTSPPKCLHGMYWKSFTLQEDKRFLTVW